MQRKEFLNTPLIHPLTFHSHTILKLTSEITATSLTYIFIKRFHIGLDFDELILTRLLKLDYFKMNDFTSYWDDTLMGLIFWEEQTLRDIEAHDRIKQAYYDVFTEGELNVLPCEYKQISYNAYLTLLFPDLDTRTLHDKSPFALNLERSLNESFPDSNTDERDFNMKDIPYELSISNSSSSSSNTSSLLQGRHPRSSPGSQPLMRRRSKSFLCTRFSISNKKRQQSIGVDPMHIPSLQLQEGLIGTSSAPLLHFRGGLSWKYLNTDTGNLGLDLFWPCKVDDLFPPDNYGEIKGNENEGSGEGGTVNEDGVLDINELRPLCTFRNLRVLKITGMMRSYQKYIWQTAWLNLHLEELELEMILEPCIRKKNTVGNWPFIRGGWQPSTVHLKEPVYL